MYPALRFERNPFRGLPWPAVGSGETKIDPKIWVWIYMILPKVWPIKDRTRTQQRLREGEGLADLALDVHRVNIHQNASWG